jgi:N-acetylglucosaminyldiphosphoundecaprenol N-acetyl-beta-D-mannosaminyltransferase
MTATSHTPSRVVLGTRIDRSSYHESTGAAIRWAAQSESRYLCFVTVYNVMKARSQRTLQSAMNNADIVSPDGVPLVWALRLLGVQNATRVYGPDLTQALLDQAYRNHVPVGFLGSTPRVLSKLLATVRLKWPELQISYACAPPFRPLTSVEDESQVQEINSSGARLLFVGLGCPKQELWMAAHKGKVNAVMLGVGAAFDFLSGEKPQAPRWMMAGGLEWLFRLVTEPRRLWKRYLKYNPLFIILFAIQLLSARTTTKRCSEES